MAKFRNGFTALLVILSAALSGCAHQIAFENAHYHTGAKRQQGAVVAVIDEATLRNTVSIRSYMTGIAHSWDAQPGEMLKQVADIELPQMFQQYEFSTSTPERPAGRPIVLKLSVPGYNFADFKALVTVRAVATGADGRLLFDRAYLGEGESQGAKMFWAGPFGMKSAVRQSSLDAYKKVFEKMRADLSQALEAAPR
jgi:hypothetical protein